MFHASNVYIFTSLKTFVKDPSLREMHVVDDWGK